MSESINELRNKKASKEFIEKCNSLDLDKPCGSYVNAKTPLKFKCKYGHVYYRKPKEHLKAKGCPICYHMSKNGKTPIDSITKDNYYSFCLYSKVDCPIDPFVDLDTPIMHSCKKCHKIYMISPKKHLLEGFGCPYCNKYIIKGSEDSVTK